MFIPNLHDGIDPSIILKSKVMKAFLKEMRIADGWTNKNIIKNNWQLQKINLYSVTIIYIYIEGVTASISRFIVVNSETFPAMIT